MVEQRLEKVMTTMTGTEQQVMQIFAQHLHLQVPSVETDLLQTGLLDSLGVVEILAILEQQFGLVIALDDLELDHFRSVASIAAFIERRQTLAA